MMAFPGPPARPILPKRRPGRAEQHNSHGAVRRQAPDGLRRVHSGKRGENIFLLQPSIQNTFRRRRPMDRIPASMATRQFRAWGTGKCRAPQARAAPQAQRCGDAADAPWRQRPSPDLRLTPERQRSGRREDPQWHGRVLEQRGIHAGPHGRHAWPAIAACRPAEPFHSGSGWRPHPESSHPAPGRASTPLPSGVAEPGVRAVHAAPVREPTAQLTGEAPRSWSECFLMRLERSSWISMAAF